MKGVRIEVPGTKKQPLMVAKVSDDGTSIDINHQDGGKSVIRVSPNEEISLAGPSVDASVMYVEVIGGQHEPQDRFYDTRTGGPYQRKPGVNPQFYV